ncbi:hypothetical protein [Domibacillus robiginosus]|uniref:hypothetical protein n=1 Tax=Domibacillus robiginosus TaxID=1071054 RepID=UPI00067AC56C|nr:hypothetical protein [Domibacillus robiginosus]
MKVQFLSEQHKNCFRAVYASMPTIQQADGAKLAILFLLTGDSKLAKKAAAYINPGKGQYLWSEAWPDNNDSLSVLMRHFLDGTKVKTTFHLMDDLDDNQLKLALNAIMIRRLGVQSDFHEDKSDERYYYYM